MEAIAQSTETDIRAQAGEAALERELDDLLLAKSRLRWGLEMQLVADALGFSSVAALSMPEAAPVSGSLAHRLGHKTVRSFVTGGPESKGLGSDWADFSKKATAHEMAQRYALREDDPQVVLDQISAASKVLNRPPADAAELHRVLADRAQHDLNVQRQASDRQISKLKKEAAEWRSRADAAQSEEGKLRGQFESSQKAWSATEAKLRADIEEQTLKIKGLSESESKAVFLRQEAEAERERLQGILDDVLGGRVGDIISMRDELSALQASLSESQQSVARQKVRFAKLNEAHAKLKQLFEARGASVKKATLMIDEIKTKEARTRRQAARLKAALLVTGALGLVALLL